MHKHHSLHLLLSLDHHHLLLLHNHLLLQGRVVNSLLLIRILNILSHISLLSGLTLHSILLHRLKCAPTLDPYGSLLALEGHKRLFISCSFRLLDLNIEKSHLATLLCQWILSIVVRWKRKAHFWISLVIIRLLLLGFTHP